MAPAHEEAGNLPTLVERVNSTFSAGQNCELLIVDDGSGDDTPSVLAEVKRTSPNLWVVPHSSRCGQRRAMRTGAESARFPWLGFLDADGQNVPADLHRLYREMFGAGGATFPGHSGISASGAE